MRIGLTTALLVCAATGAQAQVTIHQHCGYEGYAVELPGGAYDYGLLAVRGMRNNDISAIRVAPGWKATLFDGWDYEGPSITLTEDEPCLVHRDFNDATSSITVEPE